MLEKSYKEYLEGFKDIATGEARKGYVEVVMELKEKFPAPDEIVTVSYTHLDVYKRQLPEQVGTAFLIHRHE